MRIVSGVLGSPSGPGTDVGAPLMGNRDAVTARQPAEACGTISHCQRPLGVTKRYTFGVSAGK